MQNHIVVVGAGIAGLFTAIYAQKKYPNIRVHLVEKSDKLGGLLQSTSYDIAGLFDYGIHTIYQTKDPAIDDIILDPEYPDGWKALPGDWGGVFWKGQMRTNSPYLDLRSLDQADAEICRGQLMTQLNCYKENDFSLNYSNVLQFTEQKFGVKIANEMIKPVLEKVFKVSAEELSVVASSILPLNRVIAYDLEPTLDFMASPLFRSRIAIPEQRELPAALQTGKNGFYPKKLGLSKYVDWLANKFEEFGGQIHLCTTITDLDLYNRSMSIKNEVDANTVQITNIDHVFWGAGPAVLYLSGLFKNMPNVEFDKPLNTVVVNLLLNAKPDFQDSQYIYVLDEGFLTFRVAVYANFTDDLDLVNENQCKLSLEVICTDSEMNDEFDKKIIDELIRLSVIKNQNEILFMDVEKLPGGIPKLTLKNTNAFETIRKFINHEGKGKFSFVGVGASDEIYFQAQILKDAKFKVDNLYSL